MNTILETKYKIGTILTITCLICSSLTAQKLDYKVEQVPIDGTERDAIVVYTDTDVKETKKAWKKYLQKTYDVDVDGLGLFTNKDILTAEEAMIPMISTDLLTIRSEIVTSGDDTRITVTGSHGFNNYFDREDDVKEFSALEDLTIDFLTEFVPDYIQENVEELEDKVASLENDIDGYHDKINSNNEDIAKMRQEISDMTREISDLEEEIAQSEQLLDENRTNLRLKKRALARIENKLQQKK